MITAHTLVGLACLISNGGTVEQTDLQQELTAPQKLQVSALIYEEPCLPENFESLLKKTEEELKSGKGKIPDLLAMPTYDCIKGG